jgi:heme/copper-type cytochrome/quinol oxidase subunit 3
MFGSKQYFHGFYQLIPDHDLHVAAVCVFLTIITSER